MSPACLGLSWRGNWSSSQGTPDRILTFGGGAFTLLATEDCDANESRLQLELPLPLVVADTLVATVDKLRTLPLLYRE